MTPTATALIRKFRKTLSAAYHLGGHNPTDAEYDEMVSRPSDEIEADIRALSSVPAAPQVAAPADEPMFTTEYPALNDLLTETYYLGGGAKGHDVGHLWAGALEPVLALLAAAPAAPGGVPETLTMTSDYTGKCVHCRGPVTQEESDYYEGVCEACARAGQIEMQRALEESEDAAPAPVDGGAAPRIDVDAIMQSICETDHADPEDRENVVCVKLEDLRGILDTALSCSAYDLSASEKMIGASTHQQVFDSLNHRYELSGPPHVRIMALVEALQRAKTAAPDVDGGAAGVRPTVYVEARQCGHCEHIGINDSSDTDAACSACGWTGTSPVEDHCPECDAKGTMSAACPKCGSEYSLLAEANLDADRSARAGAPSESGEAA